MTQGTKKGFTIMELMLAMGVIAFLLISVAGLIIQMTNTITRGTTYKDLNTAARTINTDFTKTFNSSSILDGWNGELNETDFYRTNASGQSGAFCTGTVSYLWNTNLKDEKGAGTGQRITYTDGSLVRLAKVRDYAKSYCSKDAQNTGGLWGHVPRDNTVTDVLTAGEINLQLHKISFTTSPNLKSTSSNQMIINISYILGTPDNNDINVSTYNCEGNVKSNYCAVNRFDLTVRTLGR